MVDEKALAEVIAAELDVAEMVLTDPLTLRRLKAERIARAVIAYLSPGSTGETVVTETMIEAGHEAARAWTDRYMDGSEFVNWQQGLPDIYRAMLSAERER